MDNYYSELYNEQVLTNEYLEDIQTEIKTTNTTLNTLLIVLIAIAILKASEIVHHIIDAGWKKY